MKKIFIMVFALCGLLVMNANIARADDNVPVTTDTSVDASVVSTTAVSPDNTVTTLPDVVVVVSDASSTPVVASIVDTSAIDATYYIIRNYFRYFKRNIYVFIDF